MAKVLPSQQWVVLKQGCDSWQRSPFSREVQKSSGKQLNSVMLWRNILDRHGGAAFDWSHQVLEETQSNSGQCSSLASQVKCWLSFDTSRNTCLWAQRTALWEGGKLPFSHSSCSVSSKRAAMPHQWSQICTGAGGGGWLHVHHFKFKMWIIYIPGLPWRSPSRGWIGTCITC